jgi:hypothetical protein
LKGAKFVRVYGLDFTSNPTNKKRLTLAVCSLEGECLTVDRLEKIKVRKAGDFSQFEDWLHGRNKWSEETTWIAGLDFPFGMPVAALDHFNWCSRSGQSWTVYMNRIAQDYPDSGVFRKCIEGWRHSSRVNDAGEPVRVRISRLTDKLANSGSPMNYFPPPVCPMFYEGARRLAKLDDSVSIVPVRTTASERVIVEAYPRLVANMFIGSQASYKEKSKKKHQDEVTQAELRRLDNAARQERRAQIVSGLSSCDKNGLMMASYGFSVQIEQDTIASCIDDHDGDTLDSVLCAVQAAWAHKMANHSVPDFSVQALRSQVGLEGWIADPFVLVRLADGDS